tara:strand:+ start:454 stop:684 length:231 start_codon:yes stop_codon:yes gene_type:complete
MNIIILLLIGNPAGLEINKEITSLTSQRTYAHGYGKTQGEAQGDAYRYVPRGYNVIEISYSKVGKMWKCLLLCEKR